MGFKAMIHDGDTVSVHRPGFYAERFMKFMSERVFKKIPSPLKNSPSKRTKSIKKPAAATAAVQQSGATGTSTVIQITGGTSSSVIETSSTPGNSQTVAGKSRTKSSSSETAE